MSYIPDKSIWKSYVWHKDKCYFVSTIERTYDTCAGEIRGFETLTWEYDWDARTRGKLIYSGGGIKDHQNMCRSILAFGGMPDDDPDIADEPEVPDERETT